MDEQIGSSISPQTLVWGYDKEIKGNPWSVVFPLLPPHTGTKNKGHITKSQNCSRNKSKYWEIGGGGTYVLRHLNIDFMMHVHYNCSWCIFRQFDIATHIFYISLSSMWNFVFFHKWTVNFGSNFQSSIRKGNCATYEKDSNQGYISYLPKISMVSTEYLPQLLSPLNIFLEIVSSIQNAWHIHCFVRGSQRPCPEQLLWQTGNIIMGVFFFSKVLRQWLDFNQAKLCKKL